MKWSIPLALSASALLASIVPIGSATTGCIVPGECIAFPQPTVNVCKFFVNAQNTSTGLPLVGPDGQLPQGCICVEQTDAELLINGGASPVLESELDGAVRTACVALSVDIGVPPGQTNCMTANEVIGSPADGGEGSCISQFCNFEEVDPGSDCPPDGSLCSGVIPDTATDTNTSGATSSGGESSAGSSGDESASSGSEASTTSNVDSSTGG